MDQAQRLSITARDHALSLVCERQNELKDALQHWTQDTIQPHQSVMKGWAEAGGCYKTQPSDSGDQHMISEDSDREATLVGAVSLILPPNLQSTLMPNLIDSSVFSLLAESIRLRSCISEHRETRDFSISTTQLETELKQLERLRLIHLGSTLYQSSWIPSEEHAISGSTETLQESPSQSTPKA